MSTILTKDSLDPFQQFEQLSRVCYLVQLINANDDLSAEDFSNLGKNLVQVAVRPGNESGLAASCLELVNFPDSARTTNPSSLPDDRVA